MRGSKAKQVLVFGVFDLLHPGHVAFLKAASRHGEVTAVVTPDAKVLAEKGVAAHFTQDERLAMVGALKGVAKAVLGDTGPRWTVVSRLKPDVICVGYDQDASDPKFVAQMAGLRKPPTIVRVDGHEIAKYSSTKMKSAIRAARKKG